MNTHDQYKQDTNSDNNNQVNMNPQPNQKEDITGHISTDVISFNSCNPTDHSYNLFPSSRIENTSVLMKQALKSQKKRRESVGEVISTRRGSITPRLTKSSILHQSPKRNYTRRYTLEETEAGVQWDPHIDAFEILRAKITGITRSMQEFHVQELFQDELLAEERRKRTSSYLPKTTTSSPLILNKSPSIPTRRSSLANLSEIQPKGHRRIRSQSFLYSSFESPDIKPCIQDTEDDEEEEKSRLLTSPNLSALFLTTNNLINSRLDELSETASIKSNNENATDLLEWQKQFLNLVTSCIHQSEALESLSTDVLATEHRVRELMLINKTIHEQFQEREKQYEERIRECQEVAQQQLIMIDSLEELTADINIKIESFQREQHRTEALLVLNGQKKDQEEPHRWSFQKSVADLMHMDDKYDVVQKMRWEIGMFVGGGVGTGHVIHTFEDKLNGIDMMIAGTGTTSSPPYHFRNSSLQSMVSNTSSKHMSSSSFHLHYPNKSCSISPSIQHLQLYQHQYILHLNNTDRKTRFHILPKRLWVPDHQADQCQFQQGDPKNRCSVRFGFFQRRHHCRKCGFVICQRHSANRLPLFNSSSRGKWSRVCDDCFHELVVQK